MKKRLVALLLVVSLLCSMALAVTPFWQIEYQTPSLKTLESLADRMEREVKNGGYLMTMIEIFNDMQMEYQDLYTMYSLASLRQYQNGNDERYAEETSTCYQVIVDAFEIMRSSMVVMLSSRYEQEFRDAWGDAVVDSYLNSEAMSEEERELRGKVSELLATYSRLSMEPVATINGKTVKLSAAKTEEEAQEIYALWLQDLGDIYIELVGLRKQLADGDAMEELYWGYYREYSPEEAQKLGNAVSVVLADVQDKVYDTYDLKGAYALDLDLKPKQIMQTASAVLEDIHPSIAESYDIMYNNELYDVDYRPEKRSGAFCTTLPSFNSPFLYIQPDYDIETVHTFFHEFGHFNQMLQSDMSAFWPGNVEDLDAAEVMSNALALMANSHVDKAFGEEIGGEIADYGIQRVLFALVSACMVDEFEQFAFASENLSYAQLNQKFQSLLEKYQIEGWDQTTWTQIPHIFESPGYYISYAISSITAMELWEKYEANPSEGISSYLEAVEHCQEGYAPLLSNAGLNNPFTSPEMIRRVRKVIERSFGIMVDTYGHWAEKEIDMFTKAGIVSGYVGSDGMQYFRPEQSVTRAEFVKLLYGVYAGETLSGAVNTPFADVKPTDWFAPYVNWAVENGLVNGVSTTAFAPNSTITRQDMAVIMYRFTQKYHINVSGFSSGFADADSISGYAKEAVAKLSGAKLLNGLPDGRFDPTGKVTRAASTKALASISQYARSSAQNVQSAAKPVGIPSNVPMAARVAAALMH